MCAFVRVGVRVCVRVCGVRVSGVVGCLGVMSMWECVCVRLRLWLLAGAPDCARAVWAWVFDEVTPGLR